MKCCVTIGWLSCAMHSDIFFFINLLPNRHVDTSAPHEGHSKKSRIFSILMKTAPGSNLTRTVIFRHTVNYRRSDDHVRRPQGVVGQLISVVGVKGRLQLSSLKPSPGTPGGPVYSIFSFFRDVRDSAGTF
jgi:hypothetical protein